MVCPTAGRVRRLIADPVERRKRRGCDGDRVEPAKELEAAAGRVSRGDAGVTAGIDGHHGWQQQRAARDEISLTQLLDSQMYIPGELKLSMLFYYQLNFPAQVNAIASLPNGSIFVGDQGPAILVFDVQPTTTEAT